MIENSSTVSFSALVCMYLLCKYTFLMFDLIQTDFFFTRLCHDFQNLCMFLLHNFVYIFLTLDLIQTDTFFTLLCNDFQNLFRRSQKYKTFLWLDVHPEGQVTLVPYPPELHVGPKGAILPSG